MRESAWSPTGLTRRALRVRGGLTGPAAQWQDALSAQLQTPISQSRTSPHRQRPETISATYNGDGIVGLGL
jgi:hypothetical protein